MERSPSARNDGRQLASVVHVMLLDGRRRSRSRWSSAAPRRATTRPSRRRDRRSQSQPGSHGLVDLVQRAMGRARRDGTVGHRVRQLHNRADRGVPAAAATPSRNALSRPRSGGFPRPAACRCSPSLAAPIRRTRREPLQPEAALPRQPHRDLPARRALVQHRRLRRRDDGGLRRPRYDKGGRHNAL